jgi:hypothetical protein
MGVALVDIVYYILVPSGILNISTRGKLRSAICSGVALAGQIVEQSPEREIQTIKLVAACETVSEIIKPDNMQ